MARYTHSGNAPETTLVGDITSTSTAITVADGTGYPTAGKFWIAIDPDSGASEEHLLVNARTGTAMTLVSAADRGLDDTAAQEHFSGAKVHHIWSKTEADDVALQSVTNTFAAKQVITTGSAVAAAGAGDAGTGFLVIGSLSSTNIGIDNNEIQARSTGGWTPSPLFVNARGGGVSIGSTAAFGGTLHVEDTHATRNYRTCHNVHGDNTSGVGLGLLNDDARDFYIFSSGTANTADPGSLAFFDETANDYRLVISPNGNLLVNEHADVNGIGVIGIKNVTSAPTVTYTGGGILYPQAGALKWRGSSGTVTTIAPA